VSLTFAAPEVSKRRRESLAAGGGPHQGDDHMDDLETVHWVLAKSIVVVLAAPAVGIAAFFVLHLIR
jgi:hypothetical protein